MRYEAAASPIRLLHLFSKNSQAKKAAIGMRRPNSRLFLVITNPMALLFPSPAITELIAKQIIEFI